MSATHEVTELKLVTNVVDLLASEREMLGALRVEPHAPEDPAEQNTLLSLARFDLVSSVYVRPVYERGVRMDGGWTYSLSDVGRVLAEWLVPAMEPCCDRAVRLNCVCREKHGCLLHGNRCHGSHD